MRVGGLLGDLASYIGQHIIEAPRIMPRLLQRVTALSNCSGLDAFDVRMPVSEPVAEGALPCLQIRVIVQ